MKQLRKTYSSQYRRKLDQQMGLMVCVIINACLAAVLFIWSLSLPLNFKIAIPAIINLSIIGLALIFRPAFAAGYLYLIGGIMMIPIILGIFLAAFGATAGVVAALALNIAHNPFGLVFIVICSVVFAVVFIKGIVSFVKSVSTDLIKWWQDYGETGKQQT